MSGHILETCYMGWSDHIVVQILRASFQLSKITRGLHPHLNGVYIRFRSPSFLSFGSFSVISLHLLCGSCNFLLSFDRLPHFKVHPYSIMSFVSDSAMGMTGSDFEVFNNPLWIVKLFQSVTSPRRRHDVKLLTTSPLPPRGWWTCAISVGVPRPHSRVRPSDAPLDEEFVPVTMILPCVPRMRYLDVVETCWKKRNDLECKVERITKEKEDLAVIMTESAKVIADLQAWLRELDLIMFDL